MTYRVRAFGPDNEHQWTRTADSPDVLGEILLAWQEAPDAFMGDRLTVQEFKTLPVKGWHMVMEVQRG